MLSISLAIFMYLYFSKDCKEKEKPSFVIEKKEFSDKQIPYKKWIDINGVEHLTIDKEKTEEKINQGALQVASEIVGIIVDSMQIYYAVKAKNVEGIETFKFTASRDSVKYLTRIVDSLNNQVFHYKNRYFSLTSRIPSPTDLTEKGEFDYRYNAELVKLDYVKRDKIIGLRIGKRRFYTDISSTDSNMTIGGYKNYTIERKVPQFGFRLQALNAYNATTKDFSLGLGVRLDIGDKFNAGVNYNYNLGIDKWTPIIYAKYDLMQFGR